MCASAARSSATGTSRQADRRRRSPAAASNATRGRSGPSVARSFALLRPDVRCCHITDLRSDYPWRELFALLARSDFDGFTLCEFPQPVASADGASWLRDYRDRWVALQRG